MQLFSQFGLYRPKYDVAPSDDGFFSADEKQVYRSKTPSKYFNITYAVIAVLTAALITISTLYIQLRHQHAPRPLLVCGTTVEEARRAGCEFDRLTLTWLRPECPRHYEEEFTQLPAKYNLTGWHYFADSAMTNEVTLEEVGAFAETRPPKEYVWTSTQRQHIAHCAYALMRRADAEIAGERVDGTSRDLPHMKHCLHSLLNAAMQAPHIDTKRSEGQVAFGGCV
ncbi:hypothetical protein F5Y19DRAFT_490483 [Xylariaceae sp. FL1651]|nr:hypothetical protein F5Y19DRAFT_490483 [Xylariaceae sp. FL1651]